MAVLAIDQAVALLLPPPPPLEGRPWYLRTVQYHPILGWSGYPNLVETNDGIRIQTNSLGYRDREPVEEDDPHKLRVLFLGDSFTWGDEVRQEERFSSLLESSCGGYCDRLPPIHAINKGIIGYGTAQSFLQYLLTREEHAYDLVILGLFAGNDLRDNAVVDSPSGPRPRLIPCEREGRGEGLCLEGMPVPPVVDWPEHRWVNARGQVARRFGWSGLITLASRRRAPRFLNERRIEDQMQEAQDAVPFPVVKRTSDDEIQDRIGQLASILDALNRTIRGDGKAFGVLLFPSGLMHAGESRTDAVQNRDRAAGLMNPTQLAEARRLARELGEYPEIVDVLDRLDVPFADYYAKTKDVALEDLFYGVYDHWRPAGHQTAASLLRPLVASLHAELEPDRSTVR